LALFVSHELPEVLEISGEALVIDPVVWHGACLPMGQARSSYFVIFRRGEWTAAGREER